MRNKSMYTHHITVRKHQFKHLAPLPRTDLIKICQIWGRRISYKHSWTWFHFNCPIACAKCLDSNSARYFPPNIRIRYGWVSALDSVRRENIAREFLALRVRQGNENTVTRLSISLYNHLSCSFPLYNDKTRNSMRGHTQRRCLKSCTHECAQCSNRQVFHNWDSKRDAWSTHVYFVREYILICLRERNILYNRRYCDEFRVGSLSIEFIGFFIFNFDLIHISRSVQSQ